MRKVSFKSRFVTVSLTVMTLGLAGCVNNSDAQRVRDTSLDVAYTSCDEAECEGELASGAQYRISMPQNWNGTLLLYSHALRADTETPVLPAREPVDPESAPTSTATTTPPTPSSGPEIGPDLDVGDESFTDLLLEAGYALAGAAPEETGWAVGEQVVAGEELYAYFSEAIAQPNRVYAWGPSTGGLASVRMAERTEIPVSGVAALCAPLAGARPTYDLALDVAVATKLLLVPDLKLVDYASQDEANAEYLRAATALRDAYEAGGEGRAKFLFVAALVDAVTQSPGNSSPDEVRLSALLQFLQTSMVYRYDIEQVVGGNPSSNVGTDYRLRFSDDEVSSIGSYLPQESTLQTWLSQLQNEPRITADEEAEVAFSQRGDVTGEISVPVLSLHNQNDAVVPVEHTAWYRDRTGAISDANGAQYFPIYLTTASAGSAGSGHCNVQPGDLSALIRLLDDWVRTDKYPGTASIQEAFATGSRVDPGYVAPSWPWARLSPLDPPLQADAPAPEQTESQE